MIEAVFFDLYETLVTEHGIDVPRAARLGPALGLDDKAYRVQWRLQRPRVIKGEVTFGEALMEIGAQLDARIDPAAVQRVIRDRIQARRTVFERIDAELVAMTRHLREEGTRLAVMSNCFAEDVEAWPNSAFAPQFDCTVFSFSVGLAKPDIEIYLETARRLSVNPAHALFVGDNAVDELLGAARAGLRAVRVDWFVKPGIDHPGFATVPCVSKPRHLLDLVSAG